MPQRQGTDPRRDSAGIGASTPQSLSWGGNDAGAERYAVIDQPLPGSAELRTLTGNRARYCMVSSHPRAIEAGFVQRERRKYRETALARKSVGLL